MAPIRVVLRSIDPQQPIYGEGTMEEVVADSFGPKRLTLFLLTFFAGVVLVLSSVGLYAALAYSVGQRRHEIGIRMALGARGADVRRMIAAHGLTLAVWGVGIGVVVALLLTRLMRGVLYGVSATDPIALVGAAIVLAAIALLACLIPARRATRIDPLVALRHE
jgi:putative ABC transport system permease protein